LARNHDYEFRSKIISHNAHEADKKRNPESIHETKKIQKNETIKKG